MISYCGNKGSILEPWVEHGLSPCFFFTVTTSVLGGIMILFGSGQLYLYRKYATRMEQRIVTHSWLFRLQLIVALTLSIEPLIYLALQGTILHEKQVYGYEVFAAVVGAFSWWMACVVAFVECRWMLPTIPTRGHGLVLLVFLAFEFVVENLAFLSLDSTLWWFKERNYSTNIELGFFCWRYVCTFISFVLGLVAPGTMRIQPNLFLEHPDDDGDRSVLVNSEAGVENSLPSATDGNRSAQPSAWSGFVTKCSRFWPFIWPKRSILLQFFVLVCMGLLVIGRIVNLFTPIYYKKIVDSLSVKNGSTAAYVSVEDNVMIVHGLEFRWDYILTYIALWFLQGGGAGSTGFLNNFRSFLWIYIQQYTTREVEVKLFGHLHGLSFRWHLGRKTGEVLRVVDRGTNSVNNLLNYIIFNIIPTIADIIIAVVYFLTAFNAWFALIVFVTMVLYLVVTIIMTEWRTKFRRSMNKLDNEMNACAVDSLLNFETVKYYGAEEFEVGRYREAILKYQKAEWISNASLNLLNIVQNLIVSSSLIVGTLLCAWYVVGTHKFTVGDYVLFTTYINQLYGPLNWFGTYYRVIQTAFIDMENMYDLLKEKQEVADVPDAPELISTKGMVEFNDVSFHYRPDAPILRNLTFVVPGGQTFAIVGPSGAGKSTIIRLLFRFYDIQSGIIRIDGQDISKVQQASLRSLIGVVPQDTVLFNKDIRYNIRYGRTTASDDDVEEAARTADIHSRILTFPDGYNTLVGERGLKLSGGEKQRVAIARTVLKAPDFVLLDEATSALDTHTERNIQSSLARVCENRTTLIIAHRLSTVIHADQILVLRDGQIIERGTHEDLLLQNGVYADMWQQQLTKGEYNNSDDSNHDDLPDTAAKPDHVQPTTSHDHHGHGHGHGHGHHHPA